MLRAAGIEKAKIVAVCTQKKEVTDRIVALVQAEYPNARLFVRSYDRLHTLELRAAGVDYELRETFESGLVFGRTTLEALGIGDDEALAITDDIRRRRRGPPRRQPPKASPPAATCCTPSPCVRSRLVKPKKTTPTARQKGTNCPRWRRCGRGLACVHPPLCPAGHLPHKGGDWIGAPGFPPFALSRTRRWRRGVESSQCELPPCGGDARQVRGG